jgi:hypothetical protein
MSTNMNSIATATKQACALCSVVTSISIALYGVLAAVLFLTPKGDRGEVRMVPWLAAPALLVSEVIAAYRVTLSGTLAACDAAAT